MPDQLRRFADAFADEIVPPDFDLLVRESRRRHRRAAVTSGVAVAAVVVGVALWGRSASHDGSTPMPPVDRTPTPTATTSAQTLTADEVVDDPASFVSSLAVSPVDPDVAAAVWWHCATKSCNHGAQAALALTTDSWRTRSTVLLESFTKPTRAHAVVNALSDGRLLLHRETTYGRPLPADAELVNLDLSRSPLVRRTTGGVLGQGEAMPATVLGGADAWAIDPATSTYRDLGGGHGWVSAALTPNGIVVASTSENRIGYSADSGASWRFVPDDAVSARDGRWAVAAAEPGTIGVLEGNGGCEAGCPDTLDLSRDSGATWSTVDLGGYLGRQAVITSRGSLLYVGARPPARHDQLLRSTSDSLGDLHVVLDGRPSEPITHIAVSESGSTETVTVCSDDGLCHRSVDDGRTWSEFAMR